MVEDNAFTILKLPISFNINITILNSIFKEILLTRIDEGSRLATTKAYSVLKEEFSRGDEILRTFHITQESIKTPDGFFDDIMELEEEGLTKLCDEIHKMLLASEISPDTIATFARNFLMYKYIKKAFLQNQ